MGGCHCRIRWSNGDVNSAATWQELLDVIVSVQWHELDEENFRQIIAKRAWRWSRTSVDPDAEPEELFRQLAAARLIEILNDDDDEKEV